MYASLMGHGLDLKHWHVWVGDTIEGKYLTVNVLFVLTLRDYSFLIFSFSVVRSCNVWIKN